MPFKSEKQRRFLHANEPAVAKKWEKETSTKDKPMAAKKQGYKARQDESLAARRGARKKLKNDVSAKGRRAMASGPAKRKFNLRQSPTGRA